MYGSIPAASVWGTWYENLEVLSADDEELIDLSSVIEIRIILQELITHFNVLTLTLSGGDITIPSTGIIQWRVSAGVMASFEAKTYKIIMQLVDELDTLALIVGFVSIEE